MSLREDIYEFLQNTGKEDEDLEEAVLVGFMVVSEWQSPDGSRWLSKISGDHDRVLPPWRERMLGFEVAHEWWDDEREDDSETEEA